MEEEEEEEEEGEEEEGEEEGRRFRQRMTHVTRRSSMTSGKVAI